jgi:hypothetical protein
MIKFKNIILEEVKDKEDAIIVNVPLFLRLLEYAREEAKTDIDLHLVTENITKLSEKGKTLTMDDYNSIVKTSKKSKTKK